MGEQHGIKEVSEFSSALFTEAIPLGFKYLCIETDSYSAEKLEELARSEEGAINNFLGNYPLSFPFYSDKEEFQMLQNILSHQKGAETTLWGVDQVFLGMPRYLFSILLQEAHTDEAKELVLSYLEKEKMFYKKFTETSDPQHLIPFSLNETEFKKIYDGFGPGISLKAKKILTDIQTTQEIYFLWLTGKYNKNNHSRSKLMKKQFMEYYNNALTSEKFPKAVLKFGSTHTYRGLSLFNQFDLGNMVSELAELNGFNSTHINLSGVKGMTQGFIGPPQRFDSFSKLNPFIKEVLSERADSGSWVLIDMRPLRNTLKAEDLEKTKEIVFGNDFWIFIPEAQPTTKI